MKNIFTRALALTIVFALCAVSAFAAPAFGDVTYDLATGTLDVATSGYTAGKSATILVVKDGADLADLSANDIIYIDQVDNAVADQSYNDIPLEDRIAALNAAKAEGAADITAVNVYIGGTEVTAAIPFGVADDEGTIVPTAIAVAEEEPTPEPDIETAYAVTVAAGEYTSLDEVKAATLTVTKTVTIDGVAAAPVTLAASEYTVEYVDADGTVTITVTITADSQTATTTATYTAPVPPVGGDKTAIAGTVKRRNLGVNYANAKDAIIYVLDATGAVVAYTKADATGAFEVEVAAGTYMLLVKWTSITVSNGTLKLTNYQNTVVNNVEVVAGATTTPVTEGKTFIAVEKRNNADADESGTVDINDLTAVVNGLK